MTDSPGCCATSSTIGTQQTPTRNRLPSGSPKIKSKSSGSTASSCQCNSLTRNSNLGNELECEHCKSGSKSKKRVPASFRPYRKSQSAVDLFEVGRSKNVLVGDSYGWADWTCSKSPLSETGPTDLSVKYKKASYKTRRFHQLFRSVPLTETLLSRFACAYVGDMGLLIQGHLYVSSLWFCFHSNIFGIEKIIEIPVRSVAGVTKERTAKIIPNAVGIKTENGKKHLFGSLISRDNTYHLLLSLVKKCRTPEPEASEQKVACSEPAGDLVLLVGWNSGLCTYCGLQGLDIEPVEGFGRFGGDDGEESDSSSIGTTDECSEKKSSNPTDSCDSRTVRWRPKNISGTPVARNEIISTARRREDGLLWRCLPKVSIQGIIDWFLSLPKILMILSICVILLIFLFLCAAVLTFRLLYMKNSANYASVIPFNPHESSPRVHSFDRVHSVLDSTLSLLGKVRKHLELLRKEVEATGKTSGPER